MVQPVCVSYIKWEDKSLKILIEAEGYDLPGNKAALEVQLGTLKEGRKEPFSSFVTKNSYLSCAEDDLEPVIRSDVLLGPRSGATVLEKSIDAKSNGNKVLFSLPLQIIFLSENILKVRGMRQSVYEDNDGNSLADKYYPTEEIPIKLFLFREKSPLDPFSNVKYDQALSEVNNIEVGLNKIIVNISKDNSTILDCVIDGVVYVQNGEVKIGY